jgi:hypothetical protein
MVDSRQIKILLLDNRKSIQMFSGRNNRVKRARSYRRAYPGGRMVTLGRYHKR